MEFLLCNRDLGDYDVGDIIDVHPDGFNWGSGERNSESFILVRIPDVELGNKDRDELMALYMAPSIRKCGLCDKFMTASDVQSHLESVHADVLYDNSTNPPRQKSAEEIGVTREKNRKWVIDSQGFAHNEGEICEKVFTNEDSEIAYQTRQTVTITVL